MKAIDYLVAGVALLPQFTLGLNPAANAGLPNGWRYKGCYSDKPYNYNLITIPDPAPNGLSNQPRTLNKYYYTSSSMGGVKCTQKCGSLGFKYAATNDNQCWCDNAIAPNGTNLVAPAYGLPDLDNTLCQNSCRGNAAEACGNSVLGNLLLNRLSLYEYIVSAMFFQMIIRALKLKLLYF